MQGLRLLFCAISMGLIVMLALIHLAVSISVLAKFSNTGSVYRPERGLACFNIVIGTYGLLVGVFGLLSVLTGRTILSKIVAFASIIIAVFAVGSLITALVIHSLSISYVSNRFTNYMNNYQTDQGSRFIINKLQTSYVCCGTNTWLDWSVVSLNATGNSTSTTTNAPTTTVNGTTTIAGTTTTIANGATTIAGTTTTIANGATTIAGTTTTIANGATTIASATTTKANGATTIAGTTTTIANGATTTTNAATTTKAAGRAVRNIEDFVDTAKSISDERNADLTLFNNDMKIANKNLLSSDEITNDSVFKRNPSQQIVRRRRQTQTNYGGIYGLPSNFNVTLPQSCCTTDGSSLDSLGNLYCISNSNSTSSNLHAIGCSKEIAKRSIGQTIGFAVINSFLIVIALASVAALFQKDPYAIPSQYQFIHQPASQYQQHYQPHYQQQLQRYQKPHYPSHQQQHYQLYHQPHHQQQQQQYYQQQQQQYYQPHHQQQQQQYHQPYHQQLQQQY